jgi:hypothetical protein
LVWVTPPGFGSILPPELGYLRYVLYVAIPVMLPLPFLWYSWPMVWKIEAQEEGLVLWRLFGKRFVPWIWLTDVMNKQWGGQTICVVSCHHGESMRFLSGMTQQDELLLLLREHVPERFLTVEKENRQERASLFQQGYRLFWSLLATLVGSTVLISTVPKVLAGDLSNTVGILVPMLFLIVGPYLGATTILRAKSVRITVRGLLIKTWLSQSEIKWQDIRSVRRFPIGRTLAVNSSQGWFLLGE